MKIAIVGSRSIKKIDLSMLAIDPEADEILTGGAFGVDRCAEEYAEKNQIKIKVFVPEYEIYGRAAPIVRNKEIVDNSDTVIAYWDGISKGTLSVIEYAKKRKVTLKIIMCDKNADA